MSEYDLRSYFALCRTILLINLGQYCDKHNIFRPDFSNFMKGKKYYTDNYKLEIMLNDITNNCSQFINLMEKIV